jgi:hypothetical protein
VKSPALAFRVLGLPYQKPVRLRGGINRFQDVHSFGVSILLYNIYKLVGFVPKVERTNAILEQYCQAIWSFGDVNGIEHAIAQTLVIRAFEQAIVEMGSDIEHPALSVKANGESIHHTSGYSDRFRLTRIRLQRAIISDFIEGSVSEKA